MKSRKIKQYNPIGTNKSYIPDETLVSFTQNWLQIHKTKATLTQDGKELSEEEMKKLRESDRMKVYILDNIVFPSMANLIYFFEAIAVSRRLYEAFEDEVEELLDPRKAKEAAQLSGDSMRFSSMQFRRNNLARLLIAMLSIPRNRLEARKPTADFRVGLMYQIQDIIGDMMDELISNEYSFGNQIWRSAMEDNTRLKGWLALLAGRTKDIDRKMDYDRKIGFLPIWLSNKASIHEIEY